MAVEGFREGPRVWSRRLVFIGDPAPLVGAVFIGVIDRGTNVVQVRPTTLCPLSCIFCSVDAGPRSRWRATEYVVEDPWYLAEWAGRVRRVKGSGVEALIDGVGDPFTYNHLPKLVGALKEEGFDYVAVETHGWALTRELIDRLEDAGLDRINLSIDTLDPHKARRLTGTEWYDVERVKVVAEYIASETGIDLHVTPVWVPGLNDEDVIEVVKWAYKIGAGKRWPPVTIQKYNEHRYGRKPRGVHAIPWKKFWARLRRIEEELGLRVTWSMDEWGMRRALRYDVGIRRGQRLRVRVAAPGWIKGTLLAVTLDNSSLVTVQRATATPGTVLRVVVRSDRDGIIVAEPG